MNGIQLLLLAGVAFISLYFVVRLRQRLLDIILLCGMILCAAILILWPDIATYIAKQLGVGRGADLIFYTSILTFWFVILKLYARIRRLEQLFTDIIRKDAINYAKELTINQEKET